MSSNDVSTSDTRREPSSYPIFYRVGGPVSEEEYQEFISGVGVTDEDSKGNWRTYFGMSSVNGTNASNSAPRALPTLITRLPQASSRTSPPQAPGSPRTPTLRQSSRLSQIHNAAEPDEDKIAGVPRSNTA